MNRLLHENYEIMIKDEYGKWSHSSWPQNLHGVNQVINCILENEWYPFEVLEILDGGLIVADYVNKELILVAHRYPNFEQAMNAIKRVKSIYK